jgi:hypothetical protein
MPDPFYVLQNGDTLDSVCIARVQGGHCAIIAEVTARPHGPFKSVDLAEKLRTLLNSEPSVHG